QNPKPAHEVNPNVPRAWGEAIQKAMQKRPEDRFQSAAEFANALDAALRAPGPAPVVVPAAPPAARPSAAPPAAQPAQPLPRHTARFDAIVARLDGTTLGTLQCTDISKGGMFLSTTGELPAVFSRVKITLPSAGNLDVLAEVVRHVPADQAKAWGMPPGFGVQFIEVTPPLRDALNRVVQGLPVLTRPATTTPESQTIEALLAKYRERINGDHYVVLALQPTASMDEIRARSGEAIAQLQELLKKTLKPTEVAQLEAALNRVRGARDALSNPGPRARYDANRGNWRGIARCLLGGLGPLDLERLRQEYLLEHPTAAGSAHVKFLASKGHEQKGQLREALDACEAALQIDPLNMQLHQRHAMLRKQLGA
ncbi:MAG: PilZ domain-containing protein, partial [Myxococcota bacterium]